MDRLSADSRVTRDFPPNARYLIGVSGGRDSVALLHWLISLGYERLVVCHLNHRLRGRSGDADARFVNRLVERYNERALGLPRTRTVKRSPGPITDGGIEFELGSANIRALGKQQKMSIEAAAREARYAFFAEIARRRNCRTIFVAHHADDLVETFLINLFRGAGSAGLSAMREISTRRIDGVDLTIVRPFLSRLAQRDRRLCQRAPVEISRGCHEQESHTAAQSHSTSGHSVSGENAWPQYPSEHLANSDDCCG